MSSKEKFLDLWKNGMTQTQNMSPGLMQVLEDEYQRQNTVLTMVASCSYALPSVLFCIGMPTVNVTAEGYPTARYHAGCKQVDKIEDMAINNAKEVFGAEYANVQPHSATTANEIVMYSLLNPGDLILGMNMKAGGHLSHGASVSYSGTHFKSVKYGLKDNYRIDYDDVEKLALEYHPKLIICGTTAYCREINFKKFRTIADKVGAYLLADISHISGLVAAGLHESPINYAHITTMCTHKQLFGPRGGLILSGNDAKKMAIGENILLEEKLQRSVFPFFQGAPMMNQICAKAISLEYAKTQEFKNIMKRIINNAQVLSDSLKQMGYDVISGGTDNHIVLVNLSSKNISGDVAEKALEECGIIVNRNGVPNEKIHGRNISKRPMGIRIGTNCISQRYMGREAIIECANIIDHVLKNISGNSVKDYKLGESTKIDVLHRVDELCKRYPIPKY